jgi:hypothetical protein
MRWLRPDGTTRDRADGARYSRRDGRDPVITPHLVVAGVVAGRTC